MNTEHEFSRAVIYRVFEKLRMAWQYHPLLILFFLGGLIALGVAVFSVQYIRRHGFSYLVGGIGLFGFHNAIWAFAAALKTASTGLEMKLLFYKLQFLGSGVTPSLALVIALAVVGLHQWITRKILAVLVVVPAILVPLVIVNPQQVMIVDPVIVNAQGIRALEHSFPPLFVLLLAWGLGIATLSAGIIAYAALKRTVRWQPAVAAVLVFLLPVVMISLKVGRIYPPGGKGIDVTPAVNAVALSILAVMITQYRIFELLPVGRASAVEVMEDGYVLVSPDDTIVDANSAARNFLTSGTGSPLLNQSIHDVIPVSDDLADSEAPDTKEFTIDDRTVEIRRSPVTRQQQMAGCLLLLRDITEQRQRKQELEETNERLNRFASVVSHDLRNPLNVAKGRLALAQQEHESEHLGEVSKALDRMETLIEDMLTLARQGRPISDLERLSLKSVANGCWDVVDSHDATLTVERDLTFVADGDRLQQLLENLFRNAIEHGGDDVTIRVGALTDGSGFYVADNGIGIPQSDRNTVFESGYSTAEEGTGLGLTIVKEVADAHDWNVSVTESENGGARFEFTGVGSIE